MSGILTKVFNNHFKNDRKKSSKNKTPSIKPSMLGTACFRKLYYSYNKVEEDKSFPLKNKRIMLLGDYISDMVSTVFRTAGILIDYKNPDGTFQEMYGKINKEFPVDIPELDIPWAYIDSVLKIDGKIWLAEYKSANDRTMAGGQGFRGTMYPALNGPKPDHLVQGVTYLYGFNRKLANGDYAHIPELAGATKAEGIIYLYYNKNDSTMKEFVVTDGSEVFRNIIERVVYIKDVTARKELPAKTPEYCSTCPWAIKCSKNFNDI